MKPSTLPSVCCQISGPVVSIWPCRLATLSNWFAQIAPFCLGLRQLLGEAAGNLHVIVRIGVGHRRHLDQLGAAQPQHVLLLLALRLGDHDDRAEAKRVADQREADAGVAGGAFHDHAARPQRALAHGVLDDEQRRAILDRLARVHELGLAENRAAGRFRGALEPDQRRIADGSDNSVADLHGSVRWVRRALNLMERIHPRQAHGRPSVRPTGAGQACADRPSISIKCAEMTKDCETIAPIWELSAAGIHVFFAGNRQSAG